MADTRYIRLCQGLDDNITRDIGDYSDSQFIGLAEKSISVLELINMGYMPNV